jgi:excisionase family DNA binding protein
MFWTVKQRASYLKLASHHVYYMLVYGKIEAYKVGKVWRVMPDSVRAYKAKSAA